MKDTSSVHNEALDNSYKRDSDIEDDEAFESRLVNEPVQAGR